MATTATRSEERGEAPGSSGAGQVMQALEAPGAEAFAPPADGVAVRAQSGGDLLAGRAVGPGGPRGDATAEGRRLRGGAGAGAGQELGPRFVRQRDGRTEGAWP